MDKVYGYHDLVEIIKKLRGENGCPWDREQTHQSLIACLLEESYELVEALENDDKELMKEELGDVLLQVMMHAQIADEKGDFNIDDVVSGIANKLVYRHPHVFKVGQELTTAEEVKESWEQIKQKEKKEETVTDGLERVAKTLPALMRTQKVQKKVIKAGYDQKDEVGEVDRLIEQLESLKLLFLQKSDIDFEQEIGEILFGVVKLSAFFDINAEFALTKSLEKFINRFRYIENSTFTRG